MPKSASGSELRPAALLAMAALALAFASAALGADFPAVSSVVVFVDGKPADPDLVALVPLSAGEPFSPRRIDLAVKQLFQTGLFADIRIQREGEENVRLAVLLERRLTTRHVSFKGKTGISSGALRDSVYAIRSEAPYSEEKRARAENEIREALRKEGYLGCEISSRATRVGERASVDVVFEIAAGARFLLRDVGFEGQRAVPGDRLMTMIESRPGKPYNPTVLQADVDKLKQYFLGLGYPGVEVAVQGRVFHESDRSVSLNFKIDPKEKVLIEVRGAKIPLAPLRAAWEDRVSEDWSVSQSEARILAEMRGRGFIFASVKTTVDRTPDEIHVTHAVDPGDKQRIGEVAFDGNAHFSAAELKSALGIGPKIPYLIPFEGGELFDIPARIVRFYESRGFIRTEAVLNFRRSGRWTVAVFHLNEGPRQVIDAVTVSGASEMPVPELLGQVSSKAGEAYTPANVQRDAGRLETYYLNAGFRDSRVVAAVEKIAENHFTVEFRVSEGRRIRVARIVISGNVATRRTLIDRELRIKEGDWAGSDAILETRRGLERLGVFSEVRTEEVPAGPGTENLVINLREGESNLISLGAGLETKNEPASLNLGRNTIGPRATAEYIRSNVFGRAAQFSLITQFSQAERRAVFAWEEPYLFGIRLRTIFNAYVERDSLTSYGFDQRGVSLSGAKDLGRGWLSVTTLRWADTTLYFLDVAENEVDRLHYPFSVTSIAETIIFDRRDDSFNPERGIFMSGVVEWAVPLFQAESDYVKTFAKYQQFIPLFGRWNFSVTGRAGLGMGRIPIHERLFGGGSSSFRGEYFDELGPKDPVSQKPIGGKTLLVFNFELKIPLFASLPNLMGAVFYDAGNVFAHRDDLHLSQLESAAGIGLRYKTPLGPIRFDLGWRLGAPAGAKPLAFITIGNMF